jgi:hypothetical protein
VLGRLLVPPSSPNHLALFLQLAVQLTQQYKTNVTRINKSLRFQDDEDSFIQRLEKAWKKGSIKRTGPCTGPMAESVRTRLLTGETMLDFDDGLDNSLSVSSVNDTDEDHPNGSTRTLHDFSENNTKPAGGAIIGTSGKRNAHTVVEVFTVEGGDRLDKMPSVSSVNGFDLGSSTSMLHDIIEDYIIIMKPFSGAMVETSGTSGALAVVDVDSLEPVELESSGEVDSAGLNEGPIEIEV